MVKIILEKDDLIKIIQSQYEGASYVTELDEEFSITISIPNFQPVAASPVKETQAPEQEKVPEKPKEQKPIDLKGGLRTESTLTPEQRAVNERPVDRDDSVPNALALNPRPETIPGGPMGQSRGMMPKY